ncbi:MAG: N-6 DNA methylase [Bacteroidales bacterium]|nr:N-6 DNA methylase [Bacteroidales bacterium]MCF8455887.1 N-6 DNA methylase [Bacteroidales bacterium]
MDNNLKAYRNWLLQITICDPACGSGAFLNQALEFLIEEHAYIDELHAQLLGASLVFQDVSNHILEKNIYGVDINEESVDIAKLSLWLRTAQRGRKLTTLNNNIKCGNSLIDDPTVAGDKAFNWQKEFPSVFEKGGFDVVIGNPPYLRVHGLRENFEKESRFYEAEYKSATGRFDIYVLFIERAFELINKIGKVSFILPHKFMVSDFGEGIRKFLIENKAVENILHFGSKMVFSDASTYTCILGLSKRNEFVKYKQVNPSEVFITFQFEQVEYKTLDSSKWNLHGGVAGKLFEKLNRQPQTVKSVFENISQGVVSVGDDVFLMFGEIKGDKFIGYSNKIGENITIEAETVKPLLKGEDVKKYSPVKNSYYCFYPHHEQEGKTVPFEEDFFKEKYPLAYNYILPFKDELIEKKIRYKTNPKAWYSLHRSREIRLFEQEKIITPETSFGGNMTIDSKGFYHNTQVYTLEKKSSIKEDYKFWMAILNSSLFWFFLQSTGAVLRGGYFRFKTKYLEPFPLPKLKNIEEQNPFIEKVNQRMLGTALLQNAQNQFIQLLQSKFEIEKPTIKLLNWHGLEFKDFLKELKKAKVQLSLSEEAEWMLYFNEQKQKAQTLKAEITRVDSEIDQLVYELYGLTEEEIRIVEQS